MKLIELIKGVEPKCESCRWWVMKPTGGICGDCRKRSPEIVTRPAGQTGTEWPQTLGDAFCGDFDPSIEAMDASPHRRMFRGVNS